MGRRATMGSRGARRFGVSSGAYTTVRQRIGAVVGAGVLSAGVVGTVGAEPAAAATTGWVRPVNGDVVLAFEAPSSPFGAGHRGVDLAADPDTEVHAAGAGTVEYAGAVAGALHVVVRHDNGWRTSYSFVDDVRVRRGGRVAAGDVVATCCAPDTGANDDDDEHRGVVHVGLRIGDDYADPMLLFAPDDLTELVRLAPPAGAEWPGEHRAMLQTLAELPGVRGLVDLAASGEAALDEFAAVLAAGAGQLADLDAILRAVAPLDPGFFDLGPGLTIDLLRGVTAYVEQRRRCETSPPPLGAIHGSGNRLMFVAGINSHRTETGASNAFPPERLGYDAVDVRWYSYSSSGAPSSAVATSGSHSGAYVAEDTHAPIRDSARNLGEQLRAMQREQPGRSVDLVAHSQGGLVVQTFLQLYYEPGDPTLPPLGTVVTLASPHQGAPSATSATAIARMPGGASALDIVPGLPPASAPSVADLAETSALLHDLDATRLPPGLDVVSIGAPLDWVAPRGSTELDGAESVTVNPDSILGQHSAITTDDDALLAVRNALVGRPPPCISLAASLLATVVGERIAYVERAPGALVDSALSLV